MSNSLLFLAALSLAAGDRAPVFSLARDGQPLTTVIVGPQAGRVERTAAAKFVAGVRRDSGATPPLAAKTARGAADAVVLGAVGSNPESARLAEAHQLPVDELGDEDFL